MRLPFGPFSTFVPTLKRRTCLTWQAVVLWSRERGNCDAPWLTRRLQHNAAANPRAARMCTKVPVLTAGQRRPRR